MKNRTATILAAMLACAGCDAESTDAPTKARSGAALAPTAPSTQGVSFALDGDWRTSVEAAVDELRQQDPQLADDLYGLRTRTTRAGTVRFTGPLVRQPIAAAVFLDRLQTTDDDAATRAALVEALPRTTGPFGPALVDLMRSEPRASVRLAMVTAMRTADPESALAGLAAGLRDAAPEVRVAAARTAARRRDGDTLSAALITAANDERAEVKAAAMRTLGVLQVADATSVIEAQLSSPNANLRLAAVRALSRIDAEYAAGLPGIDALVSDADPRVAKAAAEAAGPQ